MKLIVQIIFLNFIIPLSVLAQGKSFIKTFSPKSYDAHAQNWCITQDSAGMIYVGNTIGLLVYDGKNWQSIKLNNSIVRSLAKNKSDKIFYGAQDEFGYLSQDAKGNIIGKSLVHLLHDSLKIFGDVWKTYCFKNKVIFQTFDYIFIYENEKITVLAAQNYFHFGYQRNEDFYIVDREIGLKRLIDNKLVVIDGGEFFAKLRIYGWINYKDYAVVATREKGLFKLNFDNKSTVKIEPIATQVDDKLIAGEIYSTILLSNGDIGIGTLVNGLYLFDKDFNLIETFDKNNGLKCDIIKSCYEDKQRALWLALDVGIARLEIKNRIQYLNADEGIEGIVNSVVKFNGNIIVGTTKGLFTLNGKKFKLVNKFKNDVRNIYVLDVDGIESLYILSEIGTFQLDKKNNIIKLNNENGFFFSKSTFNKNKIYVGTSEGLSVFDLGVGLIESRKKFDFGEVRRIVEENGNSLWVGTSYNGVFQIQNMFKQNEKVNAYDTSFGLPSLVYDLPFKVNQSILFGTYYGIYEFNKAFNKFTKVNNFVPLEFSDNKQIDQIYQIIEGYNNKVWMFRSNDKLHEFILYDTKTKQTSYPLRRMGEFDAYQCIYPENENVTWFGGSDGLFRYDASKPAYDTLSFNTKIRGVYCNNDTIFGGFWGFNNEGQKLNAQSENSIPELIYKNNNINFEFAALSFDSEKDNVYSYYLEGFDNTWSEWVDESKKSYTNLYEGTYTFHIKSKNVYGKEGQEDTFTFVILPPWYRTGWAYLLYVVGIIVLIYLITQISVRRLKRAKEKLEAIVINRTAEVVAEKEEVEKQKKIVEVKNKDITDSINYAQRIQQAILPLPEDFSKVFPESFIYFQPRDIVSGDFYWFYKSKKKDKNWVYIAAADCTGHGVPGAFMSMIGNTLLNEILNEKQIFETDLILNQLHIEVRAALKQDTAQNTTNDGMDIALCRIDLDSLELQYSGANRALYIFKNDANQINFKDIKPNKFPIGGYQAETTRSFTAHKIQLEKSDTFYIFSDGYADQFGGVSNKKFMVKRLQNELMAMQQLPMEKQKYLVQKLVMDWKGEAEQVDDILMIGVKV
jgi:serine phosphatase RsbU (regulator of sigma subunit)